MTVSRCEDGACYYSVCVCAESVRESGGKVLIHCRAGISRSATVCIAYLMYAGRLTLDHAHDYLKRCRPLISPNLNFMRQLAEFESHLLAVDASPTLDVASRPRLRRCPSRDLTAAVVSHCAARLRQLSSDARQALCPAPLTGTEPERAGDEVEMENCAGRKRRRVLADLLLPCGPTAMKISRVGLQTSQAPASPSVKQHQAFVFDLATVSVLMSSAAGSSSAPAAGLAASPAAAALMSPC